MNDPAVSVVIATYENKRLLEDCLISVYRQSLRAFEVILVFNGTGKRTIERIRERFPATRVIVNKENRLFSEAYNQGIACSGTEYVFCLNDDVVLGDNYIKEMLSQMKKDPKIGSSCGKILRPDKSTIDSTGLFLAMSRKPRERGYNQQDKGQYDREGYVFGVSGCAAFYRRSMLEDVRDRFGYFDERFGIFYEDLDLAWRAQKRGWKAYYVPWAIAYHYRGASTKTQKTATKLFRGFNFAYLSPQLQACVIKNRYLTMLKNDSLPCFIKNLPFILLYEIKVYLYLAFFAPRTIGVIFQRGNLCHGYQG